MTSDIPFDVTTYFDDITEDDVENGAIAAEVENDVTDAESYCSEYGGGPRCSNMTMPLHVLTVVVFVTIGLIGNGMVIYVYKKRRNNYAGNVYIITLSVLDIFVCLYFLPQYPLLKYYNGDRSWLLMQFVALFLCIAYLYTWILIAMAIDRVIAVFWPLTYRIYTKQVHKAIFVAFLTITSCQIAVQLYLMIVGISNAIHKVALSTLFFVPLFTFLGSYSAIIIKLFRQGREMSRHRGHVERQGAVKAASQSTGSRAPTASSTLSTVMSGIETETTSSDQTQSEEYTKRHKKNHSQKNSYQLHVTTVKVFVAILFIHLVSYVPVILKSNNPKAYDFYWRYLYFINHVSNPIAYFVINKQFRFDVMATVGNIFSRNK